ncbi:MAG: 1-acylglycerol-3-phosphate O-acyltransferase [Candidatus Riflebacteria bacterium]|nr:1-acylglycerol-3-phosphate O-acyltransferase [Candidatus Riflebacteria bacterium]
MDTWNIAVAVLTGISLSACTGFRAFLPPLLLGLFLKFGPEWLVVYKHMLSIAWLTNDVVLIALAIAAVVEFIGDKIPAVDHVLDVLEAPIKLAISTLLTYSLIPQSGEYAWVFLLVAFIFGGGTSMTVHGGKTALRATSTATTGGLANPVISMTEEILSFSGTVLTILVPVLAGLLAVFFMFRIFKWVFGKKGGNEGKIAETKPSYYFVLMVKAFIRIFIGIYNRLTFEGLEKIPSEKAMVVVANHASMIDGFFIGTAINRPLHIMVKKEAFENPFSSWFLRKCFAFPIDREKPEPGTIKMVFRYLKEGQPLALFPEGTRNPEGKVRPFKPGALRMATKLGVPIVPLYIANTHLLMPDGCYFPRPVKLHLVFGDVIDVPALQKSGMSEEQIGTIIYEKVCELGKNYTGMDVRDIPQNNILNSNSAEVSEKNQSGIMTT